MPAARLAWSMLVALAMVSAAAAGEPFAIRVVDAQTGRGVPMVELTTTSHVVYLTDSNGLVAFDEPGLLDVGEVWFSVESHGYTIPADGFGNRGVRLRPTPGGEATIEIERENIAERLYRVTGQGIYADTLKLGRDAPLEHAAINGLVVGQDTVQTVVYQGKLFWFWGDTGRASYPLGNFATSGATSLLPGDGGLAPDVGVDLTYFVDDDGFSRPMAPLAGKPGVVWIDSLMVLPGPDGIDRLLCRYVRLLALSEPEEEGLMIWNDEREVFEPLVSYPLDARAKPGGHPIDVTDDAGQRWFYFATPYVTVRVKAEWDRVTDIGDYEAFTPRLPGSESIERDEAGQAVWAWRAGARPLSTAELHGMLASGELDRETCPFALRDAATGEPVDVHASSVAWNPHREKWTMIAQQGGGDTSFLGELWYAEADAVEGPWHDATKIVTHDDYTFYNPRHHPMLDVDGGRLIHFEATYTKEFSGTKHPTPRYDYNQVMYRLDTDDPRLHAGDDE